MKTNIGVIFGGRSTEHEISVISANQAINAIDREKYDITPIYITKQGHWYTGDALLDLSAYRNVNALLAKATEVYMRPVYGDFNIYKVKRSLLGSDVVTTLDVVIPVVHGSNVEDGKLEGVLQTIGIPYAGCNTLASANGMDKITMKMILRSEGIPVVDYIWFTDRQWAEQRQAIIDRVASELGYPVIVKPADLGSSIGIGAAHNAEELEERINDAERYSARIIVEHMVQQLQEINCSVLGDVDDYRTSVLEEPVKIGTDFLTYDQKYLGGGKGSKGMQSAQKRIPAELPAEETKRIQYLAGETFRVLSCHGVSRVDMIIDRDTRDIFVNEINTIPGSLSFYLWDASGISFAELMERLVRLALKRKRDEDSKTLTYDQNIFSMSRGAGVKGGIKGIKK